MINLNTKEKIIAVSADLFHQYGYHHVGIASILKAAEVPKGSFYYYFSSKEDLLIEVIKFFDNETFKIFDSFEASIKGLTDFFGAYFERFESLEFKRGCPFGNFALELSDVNEEARQYLKKWTDRLSSEIAKILITSNQLEEKEAQKLASFIVSAFEGVIAKAKIEKTRDALDEFNYFIFQKLIHYKKD